MAYKSSIPQSIDIISQSQIDFRQNFESINESYGYGLPNLTNVGDHVSLTNADEDIRGGHRKLTLPEQGSAPSTAATEIALYSKEASSKSEVFYRQPSDGDEVQITGNGGISVGGLVLRAFVVFDYQGNIIEVDRKDSEGNIVKTPVKYNISTVVQNSLLADWTITFQNALPNANYMWVLQSLNDVRYSQASARIVQTEPYHSATYADTVSTTHFRAWGTNIDISGVTRTNPTVGRLARIQFQAYTVG